MQARKAGQVAEVRDIGVGRRQGTDLPHSAHRDQVADGIAADGEIGQVVQSPQRRQIGNAVVDNVKRLEVGEARQCRETGDAVAAHREIPHRLEAGIQQPVQICRSRVEQLEGEQRRLERSGHGAEVRYAGVADRQVLEVDQIQQRAEIHDRPAAQGQRFQLGQMHKGR